MEKSLVTNLEGIRSPQIGNQYFLHADNVSVLNEMTDKSLDLVLTSPPYNIGKSYEKVEPLDDYLAKQEELISLISSKIKPEGNVAWQVGFTFDNGELVPLDAVLYPIFRKYGFKLRNRIVWTFGHGMHAKSRFSGRHEVVMIFSLDGQRGFFDLDSVRVPQKYPEKKSYKGPNKGQLSGHPLGKNPSDVWDIPNVKAHHVEKTNHDCQFPIALAQRVIKSLSPIGGLVFDPYSGVATTNCAAVLEGRIGIGAELNKEFFEIGSQRIRSALEGTLEYRPIEKPIPEPTSKKVVKP